MTPAENHLIELLPQGDRRHLLSIAEPVTLTWQMWAGGSQRAMSRLILSQGTRVSWLRRSSTHFQILTIEKRKAQIDRLLIATP